MSRQERFIKIGEQVALLSDFKFKVGAVLTRGNRIISAAPCSSKTSTLQYYSNSFRDFKDSNFVIPKLHAEVNCLQRLSRREDYSDCDIYVVRVKRKKNNSNEYIFGNSRPCMGCSHLINEFRLRYVIYYDEEIGWIKEPAEDLLDKS